MAIAPNDALKLLGGNVSSEKREILPGFNCQKDTVVIHKDPSWLPPNKNDWKPLNVMIPDLFDCDTFDLSVTFPMTTVDDCGMDNITPLMVTHHYDNVWTNKTFKPYSGEIHKNDFYTCKNHA